METKYFGLSLLIHGILILILLWVTCPLPIQQLMEPLEISIISGTNEPVETPLKEESHQNETSYPSYTNPPEHLDAMADFEEEAFPPPADFLDGIPLPIPEKIGVQPMLSSVKKTLPMSTPQSTTLPLPPRQVQGNFSAGQPREGDAENGAFQIEGDLKNRLILQKILPQPVSGLQTDIIIKLRIIVNGDGIVTEAVPVQKGDSRVEQNALDALKKWRFNQLPASERHILQTGIITLYFKLK